MRRKLLSFSKYALCLTAFSALFVNANEAAVLAAKGDTFVNNGLKYEVISEDEQTVAVTGYESISEELIIPGNVTNEATTYTVTTIYEAAFEKNTTLTTLTLSEGITTIDGIAFGNCTSLTTVTIPVSLTTTDDIYSSAYGGWCGPFSGCSALTTVNLPENMTKIPDNLFTKVTGLTNITLPETITTIGNSAFSGCTSLEAITIPTSVDTIGDSSFANCTSLVNVALNEGLTSLCGMAFHECTSLTEITIPRTLETVDDVYSSSAGGWCGPFSGCINLKTVTMPLGTTAIPANLFTNCPGIETITMPDTVTEIKGNAFANCKNLTSVTFSKNLLTIHDGAFQDCVKLTNVVLPARLTSLGGMAFGNCTAITDIIIPKNIATFDDAYNSGAGGWCGPFANSGLKSVTFEDGRITIQSNALRRCPALETVIIPESVTKIDNNVFADCNALTSITIPLSVTSIGNRTFSCSGLTELNIPESVTSIGDGLFAECKSLISLTIPESISVIPESFAEGCTNLTTVTLPEFSLSEIGNSAFASCSSLTNIKLPESLTYLRAQVFKDSGLTELTLPSQVRSIGSNVFENCKKIETVTLSAGLTELPASTFKGCDLLTTAHIPYRIKKIGVDAYSNCFSLTNISIPSAVTEIAASAFSYPGSMTINGIDSSYADTFADENMITFTTEPVETTEVTLHNSRLLQSDTVKLEVDDAISIIASLSPVSSTQEVIWTSSNPAAATVDADGVVTAVGGGTSVITATSGSASASCTIIVDVPLVALDLDINNLSFDIIGAYTQLNVSKVPLNTNEEIIWTSSDPSVATVDASGTVTAIGEGTATITVSGTVNTHIQATCNVEVTTIVLTPPSLTVISGGYNKLKLTWTKVEGASGYEVYRYDAKFQDYTKIKDITNGNTTSYVNTNLGGYNYIYKVRALQTSFNTTQFSAFSTEQSAIPTPNKVLNVKQGSYSTSNINLKWSKQTGVTGYQIVKSSSKNGKYTVAATVTQNVSNCTIKNVGAGKSYYYKVRSYKTNNGGKAIYGAYSDAVKMVTKPSAATITLKKTGGTKVKVTWTKSSGANTYEVYMSTRRTSGFTKIKTVNSGRTLGFTKTGLTRKTTYYFKVRAYKMHGTTKVYSGWSTIKSIKL